MGTTYTTMRLLIFLCIAIASTLSQDCSVFQEGACPLSEEFIVGSDRFTDTPQACQDLCREVAHSDCAFFTHFNTECYLLTTCDTVEACDGCMSGPSNPLLSDCQETTMGPETTAMPATTTMGTGTTTMGPEATTTIGTAMPTTTTIGTTMPATTTIGTTIPATTTIGTTMPVTTTMPETTTMAETTIAQCDVNEGAICDEPDNLIEHIEHISHASDCQAICQNHPECNFWSHYAEEGHEHWGHCLMYTECGRTTTEECHTAGTHECPPQPSHMGLFEPMVHGIDGPPGPGGPKCHCVSGGNSPDLDECDDGSIACAEDFFPGYLCNDGDLQEIEGISSASDCQALCQNHEECQFFSYWQEEGPEHMGFCYFHRSCNELADEECREWDQCYCGPAYPDLDDCSSPEL